MGLALSPFHLLISFKAPVHLSLGFPQIFGLKRTEILG